MSKLLLGARARDERGVTAVVMAMSCVMLFGFTAFAIDLGNAWRAQRRLHNSSDAAALAAAQDYAIDQDGCATVADTYALANDVGATVTDCHDHPGVTGDSGYVTVKAQRTVDYAFGGIVGVNSKDIHSTTHVEYGIPLGGYGLRPFGLCLQANPEFEAWLNLPFGPTGPSGTIRVTYSKAHPEACGTNVPGNWGTLDYNGGANSNAEHKEWVLNGFPGEVSLSPPLVPGDTGSFSPTIDTELSTLLNDEFAIPVFDTVTGTGSNTQFSLVAFVNVKLIGYQTSGAEASRYLDLQFIPRVIGGTCCSDVGIDTGARAVRICDVDPEEHPLACQAGIDDD